MQLNRYRQGQSQEVYTISVMTVTGPLQLWLNNTLLTSANFTPTFGHRYTFVVTATDNVRNTGQGTATTDAIQVTKYYYIGSSRVAMRRSATTGTAVTYLHTDHLGTVSIATNASAQVLARTLNMPYGSVRWSSGTLPTDYGFTGQKETNVGLTYMHARYYSSQIGHWISSDTLIPEPVNPQAWNRYSYTANNPLKYIDPSGHCWGIFSFIRDIPTYAQTCANLDMAGIILQSPQTTLLEKAGALLYGAVEWGAHGALAAGSTVLACSAVAPCATAAGAIGAVSADGDPTNEVQTVVRTLQSVDLSAVKQFVQDAIRINAERGLRSFNEWWSQMSQVMLNAGDTSRMFVAQRGDRIVGMMRVAYDRGIYVIKELEGIGQGGGTALFKQAIQDSLARGFGGAIYLNPAEQALAWYLEHFPGAQTLPNGFLYWSPEAAKAILGGQ